MRLASLRGGRLVAVLLVASATWLALILDAQRAAFEDACSRLDAYFASPDPHTCEGSVGTDLRDLLASRRGREFLRELDATYETLVFHEGRGTAYYLHRRAGDTHRSCVGTVVNRERRLVGHAGFPGYLTLETLTLDGDALVVACETSSARGGSRIAEFKGLRSGTRYGVRIDLQDTSGRSVSVQDFERFTPLDG